LSVLAEEAPDDCAPGEECPGDEIELGVVLVSGRVQERDAASVDPQQALASGRHDAAEALALRSDVQMLKGSRGTGTIVYRGFESRQLQLELNGVELSMPYDASMDLGKIGLHFLSGIELEEGSLPGTWSPNALGGSLSLKPILAGDLAGARLTIDAALHGEMSGAALVGGSVAGRVHWLVGTSGLYSPGFPVSKHAPSDEAAEPDSNLRMNSDGRGIGLTAGLAFDVARGHRVEASYLRLDAEYGVPPSTRSVSPNRWRWSDWTRDQAVLRHRARWSDRFVSELLLFAYWPTNTLSVYDDASCETQLLPASKDSTYSDRRIGGRFMGTARLSKAVRIPVFLDLNFGLHQDEHEKSSSGEEASARSLDEVRSDLALVLRLRPARFLDVALGATLFGAFPGEEEGNPNVFSVDPAAAVTATKGRVFSARLSFARRSRFPSLKERLSRSLTRGIPPTDLGPEEGYNLAFDLAWQLKKRLTTRLSLHSSYIEGLIQERHVPYDELTAQQQAFVEETYGPEQAKLGALQMSNLDRAVLLGADIDLRLDILRWLALRGAVSFLYSWTDREPGTLAYRPWVRGDAALVLRPVQGFELEVVAGAAGPQHFFDRDTGAWGELGSYIVLDAHLVWQPNRQVRVWLAGNNLTDAYRESTYGFPAPGRQVFLGMAVEFQ
jgi:iron complex outermembrane receptor protein